MRFSLCRLHPSGFGMSMKALTARFCQYRVPFNAIGPQISRLPQPIRLSSSYHGRLLTQRFHTPSYNSILYCSSQQLHTCCSRLQVIPFKLSDIGEGIHDVVLKEWYVKAGDVVNQFDPICEVQSDKAAVTITSRYDGTVEKLYFDPNDTCIVGETLVDIKLDGSSEDAVEVPASSAEHISLVEDSTPMSTVASTIHPAPGKVLTTPSVRRIAAENQINLSGIKGTGRDGRILKEDILQFLDGKLSHELSKSSTIAVDSVRTPAQSPKVTISEHDRTVPLTMVQKAMTSTMTQSNSIPHFVICEELDVSKLVHIRRELGQWFEKRFGVKLTYMPFFVKAASLALLEYPMLNAQVDARFENVIYKAAHNIGIAMDTPDGLLVPNVKSVERLSIVQIAEELSRMQQLGVRGKLSTQDLTGGTITLSNIGSIGGTYTSPKILPPEVMICGIGRIQRLPRFDANDAVHPVHLINISWAADHRVIDGATVARFSKLWQSYLEDPVAMSLHLK